METIPALLDGPSEKTAAQGLPLGALPSGRGVVYLEGGDRSYGDITLTPAWVIVLAEDDDRLTCCYPILRVLSVDFKP